MDFEREAAKGWNLPGYGPPSGTQAKQVLLPKPAMPRVWNKTQDVPEVVATTKGKSQDILEQGDSRVQQIQNGTRPRQSSNTIHPPAPINRGCSAISRHIKKPPLESPRQSGKPKDARTRFSSALSGSTQRCNLPAKEETITFIRGQRIPDSVIARRKEPPPEEVICKLMFHWHVQDSLTMKGCFGADLQELDHLRKTWRVHIYIQHDLENYLCVASHEEFNRREMLRTLRELYAQKHAIYKLQINAYMIEPPLATEPGALVIMSKPNGIAHPTLQRDQILKFQPTAPLGVQNEPPSHMVATKGKDSAVIHSNLDRCMRLIKYIDGQFLIRVKFGILILSPWKAAGGTASYPLNKFPGVLRDKRWQGRLVPGLNLSQVNLLARCIEAQDILLPIVGSAKGPITPDTMRTIHSASFEFAQSEKSATTFRLEVKFNQDQGAIESGSAQFRWFKIPAETTSTHKATLQLGMIDFHRSDWEIGLDFFQSIAKEDLSEAQIAFANNVKLDPYRGAAPITSPPRRKIMFSDTALISKLIQKTAIQFRVKGTEYVLELARFEESRYSSVGRIRWTPPNVQWGARLLSPRWNGLIEQNRRQQQLGVETLFPTVTAFEDFLKILKTISGILGVDNEGEGGVLESELGTLF